MGARYRDCVLEIDLTRIGAILAGPGSQRACHLAQPANISGSSIPRRRAEQHVRRRRLRTVYLPWLWVLDSCFASSHRTTTTIDTTTTMSADAGDVQMYVRSLAPAQCLSREGHAHLSAAIWIGTATRSNRHRPAAAARSSTNNHVTSPRTRCDAHPTSFAAVVGSMTSRLTNFVLAARRRSGDVYVAALPSFHFGCRGLAHEAAAKQCTPWASQWRTWTNLRYVT